MQDQHPFRVLKEVLPTIVQDLEVPTTMAVTAVSTLQSGLRQSMEETTLHGLGQHLSLRVMLPKFKLKKHLIISTVTDLIFISRVMYSFMLTMSVIIDKTRLVSAQVSKEDGHLI